MIVFAIGYAGLILGLVTYIFSFGMKDEEVARKFKMIGVAITSAGMIYILIAIAGGDPPQEILNLFVGPIVAAFAYLVLNDIWKWFKELHKTMRVIKEGCPLFEKIKE